MRRLSQRDKRWGNVQIGTSHSLVKNQGCLIVSLCMLYSKFHPFNNILAPDLMGKKWKFSGNLLDWSTKFEGMEFVERVWTYMPEHAKEIKKYSDSDDYGVAMQVQTRGGGVHWVAVENKSILGWATNDPWTGRRLWKTVGFGAPYIRVLGWTKMRKVSL